MSAIFPRNEHRTDRVIRVVLGLGLLSLVWIGPQTAWGWVGLVPLVTGLAGRCPLYRMFGISTCSIGTPKTNQPPTRI
jgi:hypothetical protein